MCLEPWFCLFRLASTLVHTCMWSASPIVAAPAKPEAPNLIQSWKITEEMIMAEMMGRLSLACRGQGLVNAQCYTVESWGGRTPGGGQGWCRDLFLVSLETIWGGKLCPFIMFVTWLGHQATSALLNNFISKVSIGKKMNNIIIPLISPKYTRSFFSIHPALLCIAGD